MYNIYIHAYRNISNYIKPFNIEVQETISQFMSIQNERVLNTQLELVRV